MTQQTKDDALTRYDALLATGGGTAAWAGMADELAREVKRLRCGHHDAGCNWPDIPCAFFDEREGLQSELAQTHQAMKNAVPLINAVGDSSLKRLWRECGYDTPRKRKRPA